MSDPVSKTTDLRALIAVLEATTQYDSRTDALVALAAGWECLDDKWYAVGNFFGDGLRRTGYEVDLPPFTRSIDAAMTLVPPGWEWHMEVGTDSCTVQMGYGTDFASAVPACALCAAALHARTGA